MAARAGKQFLERLRRTKRQLWLEGESHERFYLTSAARNRINHHLRYGDRSRAYALVDGILAAGRKAAER